MKALTLFLLATLLISLNTSTVKAQYGRPEYTEIAIQETMPTTIDDELIASNKWLKRVPAEYKKHPEYGKTLPEHPHVSGSYELIHKRTAHTRLFQNLNGTFTTVYSSYPLHYKDENGMWISFGDKATEATSSTQNIANVSTIEDLSIINSCFFPEYQESSLTIEIPVGDDIVGTFIQWEFTAVNSGWTSDQRSYISGPTGESMVFSGTSNSEGTEVYYTNDPVANMVSPGQIAIEFYSSRTWGGSGCNATYNFLERRYIEVIHGDIQYGVGDVVINEYSASNLSTILDNYNKYEDWIELYNKSEYWVDISGFYLSDRPTNPTKWQFPAGIVIPPGGFLRIWASGRDEVAGGHFHTNFRLTQTKDTPEHIVLSLPDGTIADSLQLQNTQKDHSRGRQPDGTETWRVFTAPSPGSSNNAANGYIEYAAKPEMSLEAGFYDNPLSVTINTSEPNSVIRYTTNGHEPTAASSIYSDPVVVDQTRIIIARTFSENPQILPSLLDFNTYFIGVDHTVGAMSVSAGQIQQLLNGNQSLAPFGTFEYFNADGVRTTYGYGEFNKHGQDSWVHPQRSIDYITRDECGYNYAIREQMIPFTDLDEFQRVIIRAHGDDNYPGNDSAAHLRDYFIQNFAIKGDMNLDGRRGQTGVMYANGDYWGVYGFRQKFDHDYTNHYFNQDRFNLHYLKLWGSTWAQYGGQDAFDDWYELRGFVLNNNMAIQENYEYVKTRLDYESFVDYIHVNSFVVCTDWINWNVGWWRGLNPNGEMQRWRYTLWDEDATFNHYINYTGVPGTHPEVPPCYPEGITADPGLHIAVLNNLLVNDEFRTFYVSRYVDLYNSVFKPDNLIPYLDQIEAEMLPEMPAHFARWGGNMTKWQTNVQKIRNFINARYDYLPSGLASCYNLTGPYQLTLDVYPPEAGKIRINSIIPDEYGWTGAYFGNIDTQLEAIENSPYQFSHWTVNGHTVQPGLDSPVISVQLTQDDVITAHFYNPLQGNDLIHYWHFNGLPSGVLTSVDSDFSLIAPGMITYPGTGEGYMDRRTHREEDPVSNLNLQMGQQPDQGAVLRVRNPSDTRELLIAAPTTGYKEVLVAFATTRTSSGATEQEFYYSTDNGQNWTMHQQAYTIELLPQWELKVFDLSEVETLDNNPEVIFKVAFTGDNASGTSGNNRFDNLTVMGAPAFDGLVFYSKPSGALEELSTWGVMPDGSGAPPDSFTSDNTTFYLHNRNEFTLSNAWTVSGIGSGIVLGNGEDPSNLIVNAPLMASTVVNSAATITLQHTTIPELAELKHGSTVVFTGNAQNIPYLNYHHLTIRDTDPVFDGHGAININGNLNLQEQVIMPDARDSNEYDIQFGGNEVQTINTNGNVLRAYNMRFIKTQGGIDIEENSAISADNQFTFNIGAEAFFADNGIDIYAGNSVNIDGHPESYLFTGTLILAGTEPGIIKGAGAGNNFNIRRDDNTNAVAALNNLVIRVANTGGQFRLRDGTTDTFILNGDLLVESGADGTIRFYENEVFIAGNFIIQEGFSGSVQTIRTLTFNGGESPYVQLPFAVYTNELVCDVTSTYMMLAGTIEAIEKLHFAQGKIKTLDEGAVVIGLTGEITGFGDENYVEGTIGLHTDNEESLILEFPLGINGQYLPALLEIAHLQSHETLYKISISDQLTALKQTPEYLDYIIEDYVYHVSKSGNGMQAQAKFSMPFDDDAIPFSLNLLRIANNNGNGWQSLEGSIIGDRIFTDGEIEPAGTFALAKASDIYLADGMLVHYWFMDDMLPNDTPLELVNSHFSLSGTGKLDFYSALSGYPFDPDHPDWRKASLERRNAPTPLNYRSEGNSHIIYQEANMRGLQVKQPFMGDGGENTLTLHMPASGFEALKFAFAAKDEGAAEVLLLDYSVADGEPVWTTDGLDQSVFQLYDQYALYQIDFGDIVSANQNPNFRIRIRFDGADMQADEGKRVSFNNISLDGQPVGSEFQVIVLKQGWSGISSYINPDNSDLETMIAPVFNQFVIMRNNDGAYWPDGGLNTLSDWDPYLGYALKMHEQSQIAMMGEPLSFTVADLDGGWSYLPVLRNCEYAVNDLFDPLSGNFVIAKEVAGGRIFWPQMGINTLGYLLPGSAYFVMLSSPAAIDFPDCQDKAGGTTAQATYFASGEAMNILSPWNPVNNTAISHIVALPDEAAAGLLPGDIIGAFTQSGLCAGTAVFSGVTTSIAIYGDDMTTLAVDGFIENEPMYFMMFRPDDQSEYFMDVSYSLIAPDYNGLFVHHGLSVIEELSLTPTGIGEGVAAGLSVYPNPSAGLFNISLRQIAARVAYRVVNLKGVIVSSGTLSSNDVIDLKDQPKGIYFLITDGVGLPPKKLIVN